MTEQNPLENIKADMDAANLYSEEIVTDRKVGTIRVLTPILPDGQLDSARPQIFVGEAQIMTQMGPLPISFEIPAKSVAEAVSMYGEATKNGIRETIERIRQAQEEAATKIVTPGMPGFQAPPSSNQGGGLVMP